MKPRNILLLGGAGSGKTSVLQKTMALLTRKRFGGYFVRSLPGGLLPTRRASHPRGLREIPEKHLVLVRGKHRTLSERPFRRQVEAGESTLFEAAVLRAESWEALQTARSEAEIVVIDDLEELEETGGDIQQLVGELFSSPLAVLATCRKLTSPWIEALSQRDDTLILEIHHGNRATLERTVANHLADLLPLPG